MPNEVCDKTTYPLLFVCLFVFLKPSGNGGSLMYWMYNLVASTVAATKP